MSAKAGVVPRIVHVFAQSVPVAHIRHIVLLRSDGRRQLHAVPQSFVVGHIERRPFPRFSPLIEVGDDAYLVDDERVRAQVGHFVGYVYVEPIQYGYHGYERRYRQDHPQQCKKCPQLVRAQRIERDTKSFLQSHRGPLDLPESGRFAHSIHYRRLTRPKSSAPCQKQS